MRNAVHWANKHLAGFTGWLMLAMMLLLIADVLARGAGVPLQGISEISVFVMMIVIYLGFARCEERSEHVALEFVVNALPGRGRAGMLALSQFLAVVTIVVLLYAVAVDAWDSFLSGSAIEGRFELPYWPTKFVMVLGMVFFVLQGSVNLVDALRRVFRKEAAPEVVIQSPDHLLH